VRLELVAPPEPGTWVTYFRLTDLAGRAFGQRVWCYANVTSGAAHEGLLLTDDDAHGAGGLDLASAPADEAAGGGGEAAALPPVVARGEAARRRAVEAADAKRKAVTLRTEGPVGAPGHSAGFPLALMEAAKPWMARYQDPATAPATALRLGGAPTFGAGASILTGGLGSESEAARGRWERGVSQAAARALADGAAEREDGASPSTVQRLRRPSASTAEAGGGTVAPLGIEQDGARRAQRLLP
jgi:hypothetical protein